MPDVPHHNHAAPIILASQSPRRAALLREAGVAFVVDVPGIDEAAVSLRCADAACPANNTCASSTPAQPAAQPRRHGDTGASNPGVTGIGSQPHTVALAIARAKCAAVASRHPDSTVLAADTVVVLGTEILEKPRDAADAACMLRTLSGATHTVVTAVCVCSPRGERCAVETADVTFNHLTDAEIAAYVQTGEPLDKAGAYGIQGRGAALVERVEGDITTVIGLPVETSLRLLRDVGE